MDKTSLLVYGKPNSAYGDFLPSKNRITESLLMLNLFWNFCTTADGTRNSYTESVPKV